MPQRRKSTAKRRRAELNRRARISPERQARLAGPVGVVERMQLDALTPAVWLPRVLADPNIGADVKAYAKQLAAKSDEIGGRIPEELFETEGGIKIKIADDLYEMDRWTWHEPTQGGN